jgi:hypothetical protein
MGIWESVSKIYFIAITGCCVNCCYHIIGAGRKSILLNLKYWGQRLCMANRKEAIREILGSGNRQKFIIGNSWCKLPYYSCRIRTVGFWEFLM